MKKKRSYHAISVVDAEEVLDYRIESHAITSITVRTSSCSGCSSGLVEEGLQVHLVGKNGPECSTGQLDNSDLFDYDSIAKFSSTILGGTDDHGLGGCNNVKVVTEVFVTTNNCL